MDTVHGHMKHQRNSLKHHLPKLSDTINPSSHILYTIDLRLKKFCMISKILHVKIHFDVVKLKYICHLFYCFILQYCNLLLTSITCFEGSDLPAQKLLNLKAVLESNFCQSVREVN